MPPLNPLSKREQDVVRLLLEGKSNKLIAQALHITERTVEFHLKNIYAKHRVNSRMELVLHLRQSTVAGAGEDAQNGEQSTLSSWAVSTFKEAVIRIGKELKMNAPTNAHVSDRDPQTFQDAIRICFVKYADFTGRASRPEFWWFALFILLSAAVLSQIDETLRAIFMIISLVPLLAVGARRLRDSGTNPWWLFGLLIPVGGIIILGFFWAAPPAKALAEDSLPA